MRALSSDSEVEADEPKRKQRRVVESDSEPEHSEAASDSRAVGTLTSEAVANGAQRAVLEEHSYAASGSSAPNAFTVLQKAAAEAAAANAAAANKFIDPQKKRRCLLLMLYFDVIFPFGSTTNLCTKMNVNNCAVINWQEDSARVCGVRDRAPR